MHNYRPDVRKYGCEQPILYISSAAMFTLPAESSHRPAARTLHAQPALSKSQHVPRAVTMNIS